MKEKKLSFKFLWMCVLVLLVSLLLQVAAGVLAVFPAGFIVGMQAATQGITDQAVIAEMALEVTNSMMGVAVALAHVLIIVCFTIWYRVGVRKKIEIAPLGKVLTGKNMGVMLLMALGICFAVNFGMEVIVPFLPEALVNGYIEMMEAAGFGESVLTTLAAVCLAPIGEELVYRGVCMYYAEKFVEKLDKNKAFWIANVIQALGFGIFHANIIQGTYAFLMGLCLGYLAKRYKSLLPAMIAHCVINACSTFLWAPIYNVMPQSMIVFAVCAIVCAALAVAAFKIGGKAVAEQEA